MESPQAQNISRKMGNYLIVLCNLPRSKAKTSWESRPEQNKQICAYCINFRRHGVPEQLRSRIKCPQSTERHAWMQAWSGQRVGSQEGMARLFSLQRQRQHLSTLLVLRDPSSIRSGGRRSRWNAASRLSCSVLGHTLKIMVGPNYPQTTTSQQTAWSVGW